MIVISFAPEPTSRLHECLETFLTDMLMSRPAPTLTIFFLIETFTLTASSPQVPGGAVLVAIGAALCSAIGSSVASCDGESEADALADADGVDDGVLAVLADCDESATGAREELSPPKIPRLNK